MERVAPAGGFGQGDMAGRIRTRQNQVAHMSQTMDVVDRARPRL